MVHWPKSVWCIEIHMMQALKDYKEKLIFVSRTPSLPIALDFTLIESNEVKWNTERLKV